MSREPQSQGQRIGAGAAPARAVPGRGGRADPRFRRILRPGQVTGPGLAAQIGETRDALVKHLANLDPESIARSVREAALTELEYTT